MSGLVRPVRVPLVARGPWRGGDLQTLRNFLRGPVATPPGDGRRLLLDLADGTGDRLSARLDLPGQAGMPVPGISPVQSIPLASGPGGADNAKPLAILIHGLTGCENSAYMGTAAAHLLAHGFPVLRLNLRGAAPSAATSTAQYHAGRSEDLRAALSALEDALAGLDHPMAADLLSNGLIAIGFSLGANMLLKFLGEAGAASPVRRAVAISPPIDLAATSDAILSSRNRIYHRYLIQRMRQEARAILPGRWHAEIDRVRTTYEFDDRVVAPLNGFGTADAYYRDCSAKRFLAAIRIPTLVIHAANDPWIPVAAFDAEAWDALPAVTAEITTEGGHVGFHAAGSRIPWSDRRSVAFLNQA